MGKGQNTCSLPYLSVIFCVPAHPNDIFSFQAHPATLLVVAGIEASVPRQGRARLLEGAPQNYLLDDAPAICS